MPEPVFARHFAEVEDPRIDRRKRYPLIEVVSIAICAVICGAEGWEDMQEFGEARQDWLKEKLGLELQWGVPKDDVYRRLFCRLDAEQFSRCLASWVRSLQGEVAGEVIALDGKTLRHSFDVATGQAAIHLVNAWATESGLALGQVKVDSKSNEIKAVPALLKMLDIAGCIVTTDAMGCQRAIAQQVIEQKGDYVLCLKGNQESLHDDVKLRFEEAIANDFYKKDPEREIAHDYYETLEKDHGRIEKRRYWVMEGEEIAWLQERHDWVGLHSICAVEATRRIGGKVTSERRYFISSLEGGAAKLARPVRAHWRIENSLHWVLDVSLGEDACGIWKDNAPENMATMRRMAASLLKQERTSKRGVKARSKKAAWDPDYLRKVLVG